MPIYAYRCTSCGHAQDVLQKISDPVLTDCPACGASTYAKQVTAAGFQLKGSGWYVTDFRGGNSTGTKTEAKTDAPAADGSAAKPAEGTSGGTAENKTEKKASEAPAPAPAAAPTPSSGS